MLSLEMELELTDKLSLDVEDAMALLTHGVVVCSAADLVACGS